MKANPRHSGILLAGIQKTAWIPAFAGMTRWTFIGKECRNDDREKISRFYAIRH